MNSTTSSKKLLGIGHSHISSLQFAMNDVKDELIDKRISLELICLVDQEFKDYQVPSTFGGIDGLDFPSALKLKIEDLDPTSDVIFSLLGGNAHNIMGLVQHPEPFDFVYENLAPTVGDNNEETLLIPIELVEKALIRQGGFPETVWGLKIIRSNFRGRIIHCESPPPIYSNDFLMKNAGVFKQKFMEFGITAPLVRYKLWKLHSKLIEDECKKLNIEFLLAPNKFIDANGFLTEEGYAKDTTHANSLYGREVISQIIAATYNHKEIL